jgi:hypothetical protein
VERFETVRPDAVLQTARLDLLIALDDRLPRGRDAAKLERFDHFLSGWSLHTRRYADGGVTPRVLFVCRDDGRARECARAADDVLTAARAYAGEYPFDWAYPGREEVLWVAEREAHEGRREAYGVPRLPAEVRVSAARGDPRAGETEPQRRDLLHGA